MPTLIAERGACSGIGFGTKPDACRVAIKGVRGAQVAGHGPLRTPLGAGAEPAFSLGPKTHLQTRRLLFVLLCLFM